MVKAKKRVSSKNKNVKRADKSWHPTPLKGSFMLISMLGILASYYLVLPRSLNFGISFMIIFITMFIASIISMTKAPIIDERI